MLPTSVPGSVVITRRHPSYQPAVGSPEIPTAPSSPPSLFPLGMTKIRRKETAVGWWRGALTRQKDFHKLNCG
jgi:hypothetical protein